MKRNIYKEFYDTTNLQKKNIGLFMGLDIRGETVYLNDGFTKFHISELPYFDDWNSQIKVWKKLIPLIKSIKCNDNDIIDRNKIGYVSDYHGAIDDDNLIRGFLLLNDAIQWYKSL